MFCASRQLCPFIVGVVLLVSSAAHSSSHSSIEAASSHNPLILLEEADSVRTSDHPKFLELLSRLVANVAGLSSQQRLYLRYLQAWELAYENNDEKAIPLLDAISEESSDKNLKFRASASAVNILANVSRFEEAFTRLGQLLLHIPEITDKNTLAQGLSNASILYEEAGQYDLALTYANQLLNVGAPDLGYACKGKYYEITALYKSDQTSGLSKQFADGIAACNKAGDHLFANGIRVQMANLFTDRGRPDTAISLLQKNYGDVERSGYAPLLSRYDASLARAYWDAGDIRSSSRFAEATVAATPKNSFTESLAVAYKLLYQAARKTGNLPAALAYHESFMAADKRYLNEVSAKALAFQVVNQEVLAKKLQLDALNKQNQILKLQQSLSAKAVETSRLYIALLLTVLASIGFWAYRVKRSQMSFMRMARRDGLTGIFNRQHFVASAERQLQYCEKSARVAGLIVIDLDNFKTVNDTHGHAVGDHILKRAVAACEAHLRSTDVFGRLGGEEFGILMPECDSNMVAGRADLIRMAIASVSDSDDALGVVVSASFGVSSTAHSGYNLRQLLIHADKALYDAKRSGRNRVVVFTEAGSGQDLASATVPLNRR